MGQTISAVMKLVENKDEQLKEANDALNSLMQLAQSRQESFYEHVLSPSFDPGLVPVSKVLYKYQYVQCSVSNTPEGINKELTGALSSFVNGDVSKGVSTIIGSCLNYLMGNYSANASSKTMYLLSLGSLAGLTRIDADFYSYEYTSNTLTTIAKNVLVVSIVISSANTDKMTRNDINAIIQTCYQGVDPQQQVKIRDEMVKALENNKASSQQGNPHPLEVADIGALFGGRTSNVDYDNIAQAVATLSDPVGPAPIVAASSTHRLQLTAHPGEAKAAGTSIKHYLSGFLKGRAQSPQDSCDIIVAVDGDQIVLEVSLQGDYSEADITLAMKHVVDWPNSPLQTWRFVRSPVPIVGPRAIDVAGDVTTIFSALEDDKAGSWGVATQLIKYIVESLNDLEDDVTGAVNASVIAGSIYDCVKFNADTQVGIRQADVVQCLLGGITFWTKNKALPTNKNTVLSLAQPGYRSGGAEKLLSFLMTHCNAKTNPPQPMNTQVAAFINNLVSRKVIGASLR